MALVVTSSTSGSGINRINNAGGAAPQSGQLLFITNASANPINITNASGSNIQLQDAHSSHVLHTGATMILMYYGFSWRAQEDWGQ